MIEKIRDFALSHGCKAEENVPMSGYTSFKTGGNARLMISPDSVESLSELVAFCRENGVKPFVLGNGSNIIVADSGIDGVVIHMGEGFKHIEYCGGGIIKCGAGVSLAQLCAFALDYELTGLEFAYGIPGTVGGAAFMNAGAYGGEMKDVVMMCSHITPDGERSSLSAASLEYGYRSSAYNTNGCIITTVVLKLDTGNLDAIKYKMDATLERRKAKQPLEYPSAGSVFKRPEGHFAGALIEQCGLKGKTIGGAQVSEKHAGFIVNIGGAVTKDITDLIELIEKTVEEQTGVKLEREVKIIG